MLAEGGTSTLDPNRVHQSSSDSKPPAGVEAVLGESVSLWVYHQGKLLAAAEKATHVRLRAIAEAERDLEFSLKRPPAYISPDSEQNSKDRDEAILRHTGRRPEEVAVWENCSCSYVRKIRKRAHRDQTWGGSLEGFETEAA
jgi:hypothetical protein